MALEGSVTVPLSYSLGAQVDGLLGDLDGDDARGAAVHLFRRDPGMGMAGLMFSRVELGGAALTRAGVEGEIYRGDWTLAGQIGRQGGDVAEETYASLGAVRYFDNGLRLDFGVEGVGDRVTGRIGTEWALGAATSLRVAAIGGEGDAMLSVGVQMTFGGSGGGLKARDRREDPVNGLFETLVGQARGLRGVEGAKQCPTQTVSGNCAFAPTSPGGGTQYGYDPAAYLPQYCSEVGADWYYWLFEVDCDGNLVSSQNRGGED